MLVTPFLRQARERSCVILSEAAAFWRPSRRMYPPMDTLRLARCRNSELAQGDRRVGECPGTGDGHPERGRRLQLLFAPSVIHVRMPLIWFWFKGFRLSGIR